MYHIRKIVEAELMPAIFHKLFEDGYNLNQDECQNSIMLLMESLKNVMYKSVGMYHPLSELSNNLVFTDDVNDVNLDTEVETSDDKDNKIDIT